MAHFFNRPTLLFISLRRSILQQFFNTIEESTVLSINSSEKDRRDYLFSEKFWFLLFLGANLSDIVEYLNDFRGTKSSAYAPILPASSNDEQEISHPRRSAQDFRKNTQNSGKSMWNENRAKERVTDIADPQYIRQAQIFDKRSVSNFPPPFQQRNAIEQSLRIYFNAAV